MVLRRTEMNKSSLIGQYMLIAASVFLLPSTGVFANPPMSPQGGMSHHSQDVDWVKHTQQTLDDLKAKLNLKPEQMPAWETWANGVITDANQQLEMHKTRHDEMAKSKQALIDATTPERMAKRIERLRAHTNWMQAKLVRLDAAQARTKTFYDALETEQKTIFDLFWAVMHRRHAGYGGAQMPMQMPMHMPMHMPKPQMDGDQDPTDPQ
jgi:hypothetical protein